jgi:hypothetical protein
LNTEGRLKLAFGDIQSKESGDRAVFQSETFASSGHTFHGYAKAVDDAL